MSQKKMEWISILIGYPSLFYLYKLYGKGR